MNALYALIAAIVLYLIVYVGIRMAGLDYAFGVIIPYVAIAIFLLGFIYRSNHTLRRYSDLSAWLHLPHSKMGEVGGSFPDYHYLRPTEIS